MGVSHEQINTQLLRTVRRIELSIKTEDNNDGVFYRDPTGSNSNIFVGYIP